MKQDITQRTDIVRLVDRFYEQVREDHSIGFFFSEVVAVDWDKHLPRMVDFWENVLFFTGNYEGNPMQAHTDLHHKSPMTMQHFQRWIQLFTSTVDELFAGENAERIKQRAISIATVIQIKIFK